MRKIILLICILWPALITGQIPQVTNQYLLNPLAINPAYAGQRKALNITNYLRKQWFGIKGSPETWTIGFDFPLMDEKIGIGLLIDNNKYGVTKETQFIGNYAFRFNLGEGSFSLGLAASVNINSTQFSDLVVIDQGDALYETNNRIYYTPNFGVGMFYALGNFYSGISIPQFLNYSFSLEKNKYVLRNDPHQYNLLLNAGYTAIFSPKFKVVPSALLSYTNAHGFLFDLNAQVNFFDKFWVGTSYRNNRSMLGIIQFQPLTQFLISYGYGFDLGKIGTFSNGSHEIMLRYEFRYKVNVASPLNF